MGKAHHQTTSERVAKATARGMWGGRLPPDWQSIDAEMYAIFAFLQKAYDESDDPSSERVLVVSDCQAVLKAVDAIWKEGGSYRNRDRAGMLEVIFELRSHSWNSWYFCGALVTAVSAEMSMQTWLLSLTLHARTSSRRAR